MPKIICKDCHHPSEVHDVDGKGTCACGCVKLRPVDYAAREERKRTWLVDVEFFVRNRWVVAPQQRVKAAGQGGAAMAGIRAAKKAVLRPRQRVAQITVTITPVTKSRTKGATR